MLNMNGVLSSKVLSSGILGGGLPQAPNEIAELDATLTSSYPGTGQEFFNAVGDSGFDFWLGVDGTPDANSPTFEGDAGEQNAAFFLDGGDRFEIKSNPSLINRIHKTDETDLEFSFVVALYWPSAITTGAYYICGNANSSGDHGFRWVYDRSNQLFEFRQVNGAGYQTTNIGSGIILDGDAWSLLQISIRKTSGTDGDYKMKVNSDTTLSGALTSYAATTTDAGDLFQISGCSGSLLLPNGTKLKSFRIYDKFMTETELLQILAQHRALHGQNY